MRKAACSWAVATIRSASSWAFSMIRSPSELIRLAARTSSGTATRSSSMRPSAASWSTTTLFVSGSFLPLAMMRLEALDEEDDVDRSALQAGRLGPGSDRFDYGTRAFVSGASRIGDRASAAPCPARSAAAATGGTIVETSPPNAAISLTRLELT